ncbi:MAG: aldose 1-epimerase family protein [Planctomycetales bacterium]
MAIKTWTLTDVENDVYVDQLSLGADRLSPGMSVRKRRLRGGLRDEVDVVEIDNGAFQMTVIPTRGMGLWKARCGETPIGWNSPVRGPVHPKFVSLAEPSGIGWLNGFDELLVRCGLESNGEPEFAENGQLKYPLHGKIANVPAHRVEVIYDSDAEEITVRGVVDEARLFCNSMRLTASFTTRRGERGFRLTDEMTNLSLREADLELLYHINVGPPLLDVGSRIVAPVRKLAPRTPDAAKALSQWPDFAEELIGQPEHVYYMDLAADSDGMTQALLRNSGGDQGVSLRFSREQLPYFILWKSNLPSGDGYVTGLEPSLNFPNTKSYEDSQGRVIKLAPGESRVASIQMTAHPDSESVQAAEQAVEQLAAGTEPEIHEQPIPGWSNV